MTIYGAENPTSYFSTPASELDPKLFQGRVLREWVRHGINQLINDFLGHRFRHVELWAHPWLAGSGVSYQWSAARQPGDLDCLIGVDFVQFRQANPEYRGLTDVQISEAINELFREHLQPQTENWNGYELTFYVNPGGSDIRNIKPYAAYDLKYDEWTVTPDPQQTAQHKPEWDSVAQSDANMAEQIATRFNAANQELSWARSGPAQRNAQVKMQTAAQQAVALFNEIHENRSMAFSPSGEGYGDFNNYRWQAGKRLGTIDSLRNIRKYVKDSSEAYNREVYGVELPDANTIIRRAAMYRAQ